MKPQLWTGRRVSIIYDRRSARVRARCPFRGGSPCLDAVPKDTVRMDSVPCVFHTVRVMARATAAVVGVLLLTLSASASAQSLRGSRASMHKQNGIARDHDYSFLRTASQVNRFVDLGLLVRLPGNADYELARVSYPYA